MVVGDEIRVEHSTNVNIWASWKLAVKPIEYSSYFTFPASVISVFGAPADNLLYKVTFSLGVVPPPDPKMIGTPIFMAACHGYGDSTADTVYCITDDKKMWVRSVRRDHGWVEIGRDKDPLAHPIIAGQSWVETERI